VLSLIINENIKKNYSQFEFSRSELRYQNIKNEFKSLYSNLKTLNKDWGNWDDTYEFVQDKNENYIESNLNIESLLTLGIDSIYITDLDGNIIYRLGYDTETEMEIKPPKEMLTNLLKADSSEGVYITDENKVMIFASDPITDSRELKESNGKILMLSVFRLEEFNEKLGLNLELQGIDSDNTNTFEVNIFNNKVNNKFYIPSVNGKKLILEENIDSDILTLGEKSIREYNMVIIFNLIILILITLFQIEKLIISRLKKMESSVEEIIEKKDLSKRLEITGNDEISLLKQNVNVFLQMIETMNNKLVGKATYDMMTGIFNRQTGLEKLEILIEKSSLKNQELTGCFIDIDNLKFVNDNFSHNEGDELIKKIVSTLSKFSREEDLLFRLGGDEFFMVFLGINPSEAEKIFSRINNELENYNKNTEIPYCLEISHGIIGYKNHMSLDEFMDLTDAKMYENKIQKKRSLEIA
jgi:diguanylate cyclase (GGDEF)-like protein